MESREFLSNFLFGEQFYCFRVAVFLLSWALSLGRTFWGKKQKESVHYENVSYAGLFIISIFSMSVVFLLAKLIGFL